MPDGEIFKPGIEAVPVRAGPHDTDHDVVLQPGVAHHRIFLVIKGIENLHSVQPAHCLYPHKRYGPLPFDIPGQCVIINSVNGNVTELEKQDSSRILSVRERQVLDLIDKGLTSKGIAETLSISVHTVSRHRQEILGKLQVKNSIAACRVAKDLKLI